MPLSIRVPLRHGPLRLAGLALAGVLWAFSGIFAGAQNVTQTLNLRAGWNSVWLEVAPTNDAVSAVFKGVPIDSVWGYRERISAADFIQNPGEPGWNRVRWLLHVPTNRLESLNNDLFKLQPNRAYLVKATAAFTLQVTGRPSLQYPAWKPDAFGLRGFPVDPARLPTFLEYFRWSTAHYDSSLNQLEKIYRLDAAGTWALVRGSDQIQQGEAYWVHCRGASDYVAPMTATLQVGDGLDFGALSERIGLRMINRTTVTRTWSLRDLQADTPMCFARFSPTNGTEWIPLTTQYTDVITSKGESQVTLTVRRTLMKKPAYDSVLEVRDGLGVRFFVAVSARKTVLVTGNDAASTARGMAGLWVGTASINAVNEVNSATNKLAPTPTASEYPLRVLMHVDTNGVCRLLNEVVQMWQDGTYVIDPDGYRRLDVPGHYVLVADDRRLSQFSGATLRDGSPVGRRLSTSAFDLPGTDDGHLLVLSGLPGGTNTLKATLQISPQSPTNPFRHKYHPDHENLDATFTQFKEEAYTVKRQIAFAFSAVAPPDVKTTDYGYKVIAGTYTETLSGLHRQDLVCSGTFRLTRVSEIGVLNQ